MKKYFFLFYFLLAFFAGKTQTQNGFNYQAVVRRGSGQIIANQQVSFRITILQGDSLGITVYSEEFQPVTNAFGLVNLIIGTGNHDEFNLIDWSQGPYFIKVELDVEGGYNYTVSGISQLLSVPYALYAETSGIQDEKDPLFSSWDRSSGITISSSQITDFEKSDQLALQEVLDKVKDGVGLGPSGEYIRIDSAYYIRTAASSRIADSILDFQIKLHSDMILENKGEILEEKIARYKAIVSLTEKLEKEREELKQRINFLQNELDTTQIFAGLQKNGIYSANTSSNFIHSATSLNSADILLDKQVKLNSDNLKSEILNRETAIRNEEILRAEEDVSLMLKLKSDSTFFRNTTDEETAARIASDNSITAEMDADSIFLRDLLDTEVLERKNTIRDEETKRENADNTLQNELDNSQTGAGLSNDGSYLQNTTANYIKEAASLNDADVKLDIQVKANTDNLSTETTNRETAVSDEKTARKDADDALQNELDNSQTGAGLSNDGSYSQNTSANYIKEATSLNDADVKLDAQVKANTDNLSTETTNRETAVSDEKTVRKDADDALQNELDNSQTGAGLSNDGSYLQNTSANYIKEAASLNDADVKLDIQVKANTDNLATETTNRETAVSDEKTARKDADDALQNELDNSQTGAGLSNDGSYSQNTSANYIEEAASLNDADVKLDAQVKANTDNLATETTNRETAVSDEKTVRKDADDVLQNELDNSQTGAGLSNDGSYSQNTSANYIKEAASLNDADVKLDIQVKANTDNLATETTNRETAVSDEKTVRKDADDALQNELDNSQTGAGLSNDGSYLQNTLANYIKEAASLNDADVKLDAQVKANTDNLSTETTNRETAVSDEKTARKDADDALQNELDNSQTGAGLSNDGSYSQNTSANYIKEAASLNDADVKLDAQVKANTDNLSTETTNRETAVSDEKTARKDADDALQNELDNSQTGAGLSNDGSYLQNTSANYIKEASSLNDADVKLDAQVRVNETAIALNTSKVTNATHTGDVTGATELIIGADKVLDSHINWGTGDTQVSTNDIPEQTNLYYTEVRVSANTNVASNTSKLNATAGIATADKAVVLDASKNISGLNNVSASKVTSSNIQTDGYFYFGDSDADGTWRMKPSSEGLLFECKQSGNWVEKMTILK